MTLSRFYKYKNNKHKKCPLKAYKICQLHDPYDKKEFYENIK